MVSKKLRVTNLELTLITLTNNPKEGRALTQGGLTLTRTEDDLVPISIPSLQRMLSVNGQSRFSF